MRDMDLIHMADTYISKVPVHFLKTNRLELILEDCASVTSIGFKLRVKLSNFIHQMMIKAPQ